MKFSPKQYAQALMESLDNAGPKGQDQILDNFAKVLAENHDTGRFEEISTEFHKLELDKKGVKLAQVVTAHEPSHENDQKILHELNRIVEGKLELNKTVDEKIIGGVVIRMDDQILDASVKNSLEQLKRDLTN